MLVVSHEFGHYIAAKKSGIKVTEFGFGYPPRICKLFTKGETEFTLNWLPFGGFVKIFGEDADDENTNGPERDRSFVHKPARIKAMVLVAGVFFNFILAWLLISIGFMSGLPTSTGAEPAGYTLNNTALVITSVLPKSPADIAKLKAGDKIISLAEGKDLLNNPNTDTLKSFITSHSEKEINILYTRAGVSESATVTPKANLLSGTPGIGIGMDMIGTLKLPVHIAVWEGLKLTWDLTKHTAGSLWKLVHDAVVGHADLSGIAGPVGIVGIVGDAYHFGFIYLLSFTALISINLAIINLLPFPALDGGRLLFLIIEKIKGSRINPKIANAINTIGFAILIIFMLIVTYHDIIKLI